MIRPKTLHAHYLVVEQARLLCLGAYEELMKNNAVRAEWKRRHPGAKELGLQAAFLRRYMRAWVAPARAMLANMLNGPYDDAFKSRIHEALCLDNSLLRGREGAAEVVKGLMNESPGQTD